MDYLVTGPASATVTLVLAHGAGAAMDSPFMDTFADGLAVRGIRVVRFEFPYMAARRKDGKRRPPDRQPVLLDTWRTVIAERGRDHRLFIGGKSMGGRMASLIADETGAAGLVCLGYPFHPPGRPEKLRTAHLETLRTPALIVQGTRDPFGTRDEVTGYALSPAVRLHWAGDGNHDLAPRKSSGLTTTDNWNAAMDAIAEFVKTAIQEPSPC